jgi:hypothetical protein
MKTFESVRRMAEAIAAGEVPTDVVSPGQAAEVLGVTRQAVHQRLMRGTLRGWAADGVVLIELDDVRQARREKRALQKVEQQREKRRYGAGTM